MKPLTETVDLCLAKMKHREVWTWEKWWRLLGGTVPHRNTWAYHEWLEHRSKEKMRINRELAKFLQAERLICVGGGQGLYLVDKSEVTDITVEQKVTRFINHLENAEKTLQALATAKSLSSADIQTCLRMSSLFELQGNALLGTVAKMRSLPEPIRKKLKKKFRFDSDGEKRAI